MTYPEPRFHPDSTPTRVFPRTPTPYIYNRAERVRVEGRGNLEASHE